MAEYFKEVGQIMYEGGNSDNPLAFRYYNPEEVVAGKKMKDHLRFAVAYWHTFQATGADPFGAGTAIRPFVAERYRSYSTGVGKDIVNRKVGFRELEKYALEHDQAVNASGRQELLETMLNQYILEG